jgi:arylsulfatase A-like enzyme
MPLIAWWGDKIKEAVEINEYISLADIAPTFLDAAGVFYTL